MSVGYFIAVLMGLSMGMIGAGGSILTVPLLVYLFSQDGLTATAGSLFIVGVCALTGAMISAKRGLIDFKTGVTFAVPSFVGVFFARKVILPLIPQVIELPLNLELSKPTLVLVSFAVLMIFASRAMIRSRDVSLENKDHGFVSIVLKGFSVGCVTGFVGAGGGFIIVPSLVLLLHVPMKRAVGTSLAIIAANSFFGFTITLKNHQFDWRLLLTIAGLGVLGMVIGQRLSSRVSDMGLRKGFGYFVLAVGLFLLIDQGLSIFVA